MFPRYPELISKTDLLGGNILVFAPHPDDEVVGCGGMVIFHTDAGDRVKVIYVTDGSRGGKKESFEASYVEERVQEAAKACAVLGVREYEFWAFPDQGLVEKGEFRKKAAAAVASFQPDRVYVASPFELHKDHLVVSYVVNSVLDEAGFQGSLMFCEISESLRPNLLVDITQVMALKEEALQCYLSQLEANDYLPKMRGLNQYRTVNIDISGVDYVEAYLEVRGTPSPDFKTKLASLVSMVEGGRKVSS